MKPFKLHTQPLLFIFSTSVFLLLSGCTMQDAGHLLYQSAVSNQKFQCEADKLGNSIEACKQNINNAVNTKAQASNDKHVHAPGYEPKDYINKQLQKNK